MISRGRDEMVDGVVAVGLVDADNDLRSRVEGVRREDVTRLVVVDGLSRLWLLRGERGDDELTLERRTLGLERVVRWEDVEGEFVLGLICVL